MLSIVHSMAGCQVVVVVYHPREVTGSDSRNGHVTTSGGGGGGPGAHRGGGGGCLKGGKMASQVDFNLL